VLVSPRGTFSGRRRRKGAMTAGARSRSTTTTYIYIVIIFYATDRPTDGMDPLRERRQFRRRRRRSGRAVTLPAGTGHRQAPHLNPSDLTCRSPPRSLSCLDMTTLFPGSKRLVCFPFRERRKRDLRATRSWSWTFVGPLQHISRVSNRSGDIIIIISFMTNYY